MRGLLVLALAGCGGLHGQGGAPKPTRIEIAIAPEIHAGEGWFAYTRVYDADGNILASDDAFEWSAQHAEITPGTCKVKTNGCVADSTAATFTPSQPEASITARYRGLTETITFPVLARRATALETQLARAIASGDAAQAEHAARAFGDAQELSPALIAFARSPMTAAMKSAQGAAIATLGKLPGGTPTLIEILSRPREGDRELYLATAGSAVNGLGYARDPTAIEALLVEMYRAPELLDQIQRTLVAIGPAVLPLAREALRGELPAVEAMHPNEWCDASGACKPTGTREYYAAEVIGQQPDVASVPDLIAALALPPQVAWYRDGVPSKGPQLVAIVHALREINAPEAAAPLRALWKSKDLELRERAIDDYVYVARDAKAVPELQAIIGDAKAPDELRQRAAIALGMLARDAKAYAPLGRWVAELEKNGAHDEARAMAALAGGIAAGTRCGDDMICYALTMVRPKADVVADAKLMLDASSWSVREQDWLAGASVLRSLIELGKHRVVDELPHVLHVVSHSPSEYVKIALWVTAQLAPRPCPDCVTAIETALKTAPDPLKRSLELARNLYR